MSKTNPRKSGRGRPRSAERTALVAAQIQRQDALARRTARQVRDLDGTHMAPGEIVAEWAPVKAAVDARIGRIPGEVAAAVVEAAHVGPGRVHHVLLAAIDRALHELAQTPRQSERPARAARLRASTSLAGARARAAELHARLIDRREQIVAGELVHVGRVRQGYTDLAVSLRSRLRALPSAHVPTIAAVAQTQGAAAVTALLAERIDTVLRELDRGEAIR